MPGLLATLNLSVSVFDTRQHNNISDLNYSLNLLFQGNASELCDELYVCMMLNRENKVKGGGGGVLSILSSSRNMS